MVNKSMKSQKNCPVCDWDINWEQVIKEGEMDLCPKCKTRLVGEVKNCEKCGQDSPVDAFYCLHCRASFPVESVPGFLQMMQE